jgi:predicted TIM-barrel fold metal-dependent hydrolase
VEAFGANRCLFGSNCPPDTLFYDFHALLDVYKDAFAERSAEEQSDLFFGTARRVYRL